MMLRNSSDLVLISLVAFVTGLLVVFGLTVPILQILLGLPLVLILPGYALTAVFFLPRTLNVPERLLFSVGVSLMVTILGGLVLHWADFGLTPVTQMVWLVVITLVASLFAGWRRRGGPAFALPNIGLSPLQVMAFGLAGLIVFATIAFARIPSPPDEVEGYTLLWILPAETGDALGVRVGIDSDEFKPVDYHLVLTLDDKPLQAWETIRLEPGQNWEATVEIPSDATGLIAGALYRLDNPNTVYRQVKLWYRQPQE